MQLQKRESGKERRQRIGLLRYCFGNFQTTEESEIIPARSFEDAVLTFKTTCIMPERYCRPEDRETDENGKFIRKEHNQYESAFALKNNPQILVIEEEEREFEEKTSLGHVLTQKRWVATGREWLLPLSECIEVSYKQFDHVQNLIGQKDDRQAEISNLNLPLSKSYIISKRNELEDARLQLESQLHDLEAQIRALNEQITSKRKSLLAVQIYNGVACDCYQLLEGRPAVEGTRLSIYQEKLYVDEQIAVFACQHGIDSFDYNNLDEFEDFLRQNFKNFHYRPLSVIAWQIRRTEKNYGDPLSTMMENHWNYMTLITIRNGEQLYTVYCDEFRIGDVVFPRSGELERIDERWKKIISSTSSKEAEVKAYYEKYMFGLLLIQGILDRTDLLGSWNKGINLIKGDEKCLELIRDAEPDFWLGDGHETFSDWIERNRKSIKEGSRVLFLGSRFNSSSWADAKEESIARTGRSFIDWPSSDQVYVINKIGRWYRYLTECKFYQFSYLPSDPVSYRAFMNRSGESDGRTRRIGFKAHGGELLNLDELRAEDIDYFLSNRLYKSQYMQLLPILSVAKKALKKEMEEAAGFKTFIRTFLNFEVTDGELDAAIEQFKLKKFKSKDERKWKRGLMDDKEKGNKACQQIRELLIYNRNANRLLAKDS